MLHAAPLSATAIAASLPRHDLLIAADAAFAGF